jgi:hypothetical protein
VSGGATDPLIRNHRGWIDHHEKMLAGLRMKLAITECSTPTEDTAALQRVLEIFERERDLHIKAAASRAADLATRRASNVVVTSIETAQ